jgi:pyruvate kinase
MGKENFNKKTKIICTIGPASSTKEMIVQLINSGMDIARLNFSHGSYETHLKNIENIRAASKELAVPVGILQDLQGPKIRVGKLYNDILTLKKNQNVTLKYGQTQIDDEIPIDYEHLYNDVKKESRVLMDDGKIELKITKILGDKIICKVIHDGLLKSRKSVNFPDCKLSIPSLTQKDLADVNFGISHKVDFLALSFVQSHEDVIALRKVLQSQKTSIPIISKIEMNAAIKNINRICKESDGIMIARGDMGVECGFSKIAFYQKLIIKKCKKFHKPVIVATQMLESMIFNSKPTSSEICDVANAAFDSVDATMLSAESASGNYPVKATSQMKNILISSEKNSHFALSSLNHVEINTTNDIFAKIALSIAIKAQAKYIVCITMTGQIAKIISRFRAPIQVIALCPDEKVLKHLKLYRGLSPIAYIPAKNTGKAFLEIIKKLKELKIISKSDIIVLTGGIPAENKNPTNSIKIHKI